MGEKVGFTNCVFQKLFFFFFWKHYVYSAFSKTQLFKSKNGMLKKTENLWKIVGCFWTWQNGVMWGLFFWGFNVIVVCFWCVWHSSRSVTNACFFFPSFLAFCGVACSCLFWVWKILSVFVFLVFVFVFGVAFVSVLFALFLFCCWIIFGVGSCFDLGFSFFLFFFSFVFFVLVLFLVFLVFVFFFFLVLFSLLSFLKKDKNLFFPLKRAFLLFILLCFPLFIFSLFGASFFFTFSFLVSLLLFSFVLPFCLSFLYFVLAFSFCFVCFFPFKLFFCFSAFCLFFES